MKINGRKVKLSDFMPKYADEKADPKQKELKLKAALMAMASRNKPNGKS